jgi:uncharacterized membrane protein
MNKTKRPLWLWITAIVAIIFGAMTIKSGGEVLFIDGAGREAAGHYVPFVLWFNFIAGFFYIITGLGLWQRQRWARMLAVTLAVTTLAIFAALGIHILNQGAYEMRTVIAMTIRSAVWLSIALTCWFLWQPDSEETSAIK